MGRFAGRIPNSRFAEEVWWLFMNEKGRVVKREQGLQEKYFSMLIPGRSTESDVWAMWGEMCTEIHVLTG